MGNLPITALIHFSACRTLFCSAAVLNYCLTALEDCVVNYWKRLAAQWMLQAWCFVSEIPQCLVFIESDWWLPWSSISPTWLCLRSAGSNRRGIQQTFNYVNTPAFVLWQALSLFFFFQSLFSNSQMLVNMKISIRYSYFQSVYVGHEKCDTDSIKTWPLRGHITLKVHKMCQCRQWY